MAEAHLVCGSTGAGKTTYAVQLARRLGAVRFSIDEWMSALFWMDSPRPLDGAWSLERVERCNSQIWAVAREVLLAGVDVVLDLGFTSLASRSRFRSAAEAGGIGARLHFVDVPAEERWRRVQRRNLEAAESAPAQLPFAVDRAMFDFVEDLWEPPTLSEIERFSRPVNAPEGSGP